MNNLEYKLKNLKTNDYIIPTHKRKLRRALLNSSIYKKKAFAIFSLLKPLAFSTPVIAVLIIIFLITSTVSSPTLFDDLDSFAVSAAEKIEEQIAQTDGKYYYVKTNITEKQETPRDYAISYYSEVWEDLETHNYRLLETDESGNKIYEYKKIGQDRYSCEDCFGTAPLVIEATKDQEYTPFQKDSFADYWIALDQEGKMESYPGTLSSFFDYIQTPLTIEQRLEILNRIQTFENVDFQNNYLWSNQNVYAIGYSWEYEDILKEEQYIYFDQDTLAYLGSTQRQYVNGEINKDIEIIVEDESFTVLEIDWSLEGMEKTY